MARKKRKQATPVQGTTKASGIGMQDVPLHIQATLTLEARSYFIGNPHESRYWCLLTPEECQLVGWAYPTIARVQPLRQFTQQFFITLYEVPVDVDLVQLAKDQPRLRQALRDRLRR